MIELEKVTKLFGNKRAVDELTLMVPGGELFCFLGPNGAGKTTTIKLLAGLLRPTAGRVRICGYDVTGQYVEAKRRMSYVPDQPFLYEKLTGWEFLQFVGRIYNMEQHLLDERIEQLVELFECLPYVDELTESYSHGMKQRVVMASALLHNPDVIVIDEPFVGLDPHSTRLVKDILRARTQNGKTAFLSTHTLSVAEELATRIGIVNHGRLVALGTLEELRQTMGGDNDSLEDLFLELTRNEHHGKALGADRLEGKTGQQPHSADT